MAIARHCSKAHHFTLAVGLALGALTASCTEGTENPSGGSGTGQGGSAGAGESDATSKSASTGAGQGGSGGAGQGGSGGAGQGGSGGAGQGGSGGTGQGGSGGAGQSGSGGTGQGGSGMTTTTTTSGGPICADCDDKDACTDDACEQGTCKHAKVDPDDKDACTLDSCNPKSGVMHTKVDPDDKDACTLDSCDPKSGVMHTKVDPDDKNACTLDSCDPKSGVMHTARVCDDKDACTLDSCDPSVGCVTTPIRYFVETFADNSKGWQLGGLGTGTPWEIGPLKPNPTPPGYGSPDPTLDHTPTADNGVAGVSIGNNTGTAPHAPYYLVSPTIDATLIQGPVFLEFWRFLNSDVPPYMNSTVEVFNGTAWVLVYGMSTGVPVNDAQWVRQSFDVSAYKSNSLQVRWGWEVKGSGAISQSGWNVDDVRLIPANNCP
jgi:Dictyostelium (slime mold) repeat